MNYNKLLLGGNLTRDPELKYATSGNAICKFGMAVNRKWKGDGGAKEEVTFVDVTAFGKTGEAIAQYCKKGANLFIEGRLKLESWDDKKTGEKRSKLCVICESFEFTGGKRDDAQSELPPAKPDAPKPAGDAQPPADDPIPF